MFIRILFVHHLFYISVQRESDGSLLNFQTCIECAPGTRPSEDKTHCVICPFNNYYSGMIHCDCPSKSHESLKPDVCAPVSSMTNWPDEPSAYNIEYPLVNQIIQSWFFKENLRLSVYLCKVSNHCGFQLDFFMQYTIFLNLVMILSTFLSVTIQI